jgi:hypothetical protein
MFDPLPSVSTMRIMSKLNLIERSDQARYRGRSGRQPLAESAARVFANSVDPPIVVCRAVATAQNGPASSEIESAAIILRGTVSKRAVSCAACYRVGRVGRHHYLSEIPSAATRWSPGVHHIGQSTAAAPAHRT